MRAYSVGGLILIVLGILAFSVHSITYFSTEHVTGPLGFFAWDVSRPHTIFINPFAGILALIAGVTMILVGHRSTSA
jgi:hypothetical protein